MADEFFLSVLSAIANVVGTLIVDYLVKPIGRRVRYLFRLNKITEELREQKQNLSKEQIRVREEVNEAKRVIRTQVIEKDVEDWLMEVEKVLNDAQILEGKKEENKICFRWCQNWRWKYKLSKEIEKKTLAITKLVNSSKFERYGHRAELPIIELFESEGYLPSKSAITAFNEIMEALKGDKVNTIGVWGIGGVGKTTLVKKVGNDIKNIQHEVQLFKQVVFVHVSQSPDFGNIQQKIADFIDLKFEKKTQEGKAAELWSRLAKEETILIILDDMWKELNLKKIRVPLAENRKGCRIIFTTRRRQVCTSMASQVTVPLGVLDEDETWNLFKMKGSLDEEKVDAEAIKVAMEVAKKCKGLPVAIVPLARALKDTKTIEGWKIALKKLQNNRLMEIGNIEEEEKNAYMCLKMSYDYLKKKTIKRCFLLSALFPEDHSIDVEEELVRYAWGLELYPNATSIEELRIEVIGAIDYLKDSCLLLEDGERYIKVHDVVRDVALLIASEEDNGFVRKPGVRSENENYKKKLEILLLDDYVGEISIEYFDGKQELKVLSLKMASLEGVSFFSFNALKPLTNLRALKLKGFVHLGDVSALVNLRKLEILSLYGFIFEESMDGLGELKDLKVLDLRGCRSFRAFAPNFIQRLHQIEELHLNISIGNDGVTSLWLDHFPKGFVFPSLQRYTISIYKQFNIYPKGIMPSRSLRISWDLPLHVFQKLLHNVEFLEMKFMRGIKEIQCRTDRTPGNVSVEKVLQNPKYVKIYECENLQVIFQMEKAESREVVQQKLKYLWLERLPNLGNIWKMPTQHLSLGSLETIVLDNCGKLTSLFSFSIARSLASLEKLVVKECGKVKQIVEDEQEVSASHDNFLCLPKLSTLEIDGCDSLEYIFPNSMAPQGLQQLQKLQIKSLPQLKQICKAANERLENGTQLPQHQILLSLTNLEVRDCSQWSEAMIHLKPVHADLKEIQLSKLKPVILHTNTVVLSLGKITDHNLIPEAVAEELNQLTSFTLFECNCLEYLVDATKEHVPNTAFNNLLKLYMRDLGGLKAVCKGQIPNGFLQNLKLLHVVGCGKLQQVFQIDELRENQPQVLSNLEHLMLSELSELRWILKGPAHHFSLRSLKVVKIYRCEELRCFFSPSLIQSLQQLEELDIGQCGALKTLFAELENDGETESNSLLHPQFLPSLKTLRVSSCGSLQSITLDQLGLPKLESLKIEGCGELKTLFAELESDDEIESNNNLHPLCLPKLKSVDVAECATLEYLLPMPLAQSQGLPQLESVRVWHCPQLKQVCGVAKQHGEDAQHCINLPRLEGLNSTNLSNSGPENFSLKAPVLKKISVAYCPRLMTFNIQQEVNNNIQIELEEVPEVAFKDVIRNAKNLTLSKILDQKNLTSGENVGGENYKHLEYLVDTTEEHVPTSGVFTNMVKLQMRCMNGLKMLFSYCQPPKGFLHNLESMWMTSCQDIVSLYPVAPNLEDLRVEDCKKLQEVFRIHDRLYDREENQAQLLSKLDCLWLESLPELRWIFKGPTQYVSLGSLLHVSIHKCKKLKSLFSFSLFLGLMLLEYLAVSECDELEAVFPELESDDDTESNTLLASAQGLPRLRVLCLGGLTRLKSFGPQNYSIKAPVLEELTVFDCPKLSSFTIQQEDPLQMKEIEECIDYAESSKLEYPTVNDGMSASQGHDQVKAGVKNEKEKLIFPRLKLLVLGSLPSLWSSSPAGYDHLLFPSLHSLIIKDCSRLNTNFTVDSTSCVHAKAKASRLEKEETKLEGPIFASEETYDTSRNYIHWRRIETIGLPPYTEESE